MMMKNARQKYNTLHATMHAPELCSKLMNLFNNPYMILPGYFFLQKNFDTLHFPLRENAHIYYTCEFFAVLHAAFATMSDTNFPLHNLCITL